MGGALNHCLLEAGVSPGLNSHQFLGFPLGMLMNPGAGNFDTQKGVPCAGAKGHLRSRKTIFGRVVGSRGFS